MTSVPWRSLEAAATEPAYAHPGDAGADLCSTIDVSIKPGERVVVGTGVAVALPDGYVGLIAPRSGLAVRRGLSIVNTPGVLDAGYRGEIKVCLINLDPRDTVEVTAGDRIAQLVIVACVRAEFVRVGSLDDTQRGAGGYGSTGGASALRRTEPT